MKTILFHHEDGRVLRDEVFAGGPEPGWYSFDEEMVLVTGKRADGSYDVKPHPRAAEIVATMFAEPLAEPLEDGFVRAHRIAMAPLDKPVPSFVGYQVRRGWEVRFFPALEPMLVALGIASSEKARTILRFLSCGDVARPKLGDRDLGEVTLIEGPDLGPCIHEPAGGPRCTGRLFPQISADGSAWEADHCNTCNCSWFHDPPKTPSQLQQPASVERGV